MINFSKQSRNLIIIFIVTLVTTTGCGELEKSDTPRGTNSDLNNENVVEKENSKMPKKEVVKNEDIVEPNKSNQKDVSKAQKDISKAQKDISKEQKDISKEKNALIDKMSEKKKQTENEDKSKTDKSNPSKSKRESWYITLNNENKPTVIPNYRKELLRDTNSIYIGDTLAKKIYLTFDIGTVNENIETVLDILKEKGVKTIFFITSEIIIKKPDLLLRMIQEGHAIGNHTMSHNDLTTLTPTELEYELKDLDKLYYELTKQKMKYFRTPFGVFDEKTLKTINELGYKSVFWSYAFNDYDESLKREPKFSYNKIMANYHNGAIILLHAGAKCNADDLAEVIDGLRGKGYSLEQLDF